MSSEVTDNLRGAFTFISERGVLGGIYTGTLIFGLVVGSEYAELKEYLLWLLIICLLIGLIMTSITYELFMPAFRFITSPIAVYSFKKTVKPTDTTPKSYTEIRKYRELFLASDGAQHLKDRILKDEGLRRNITYFSTSSILAFIVIFSAPNFFVIPAKLLQLERYIVLYIFISTLVGQVSRTISLGRSIGFAYLAKPL